MGTVSVRDVRIINDKYTGLPRGLAFVEMWGVSEAARALAVLQGAVPRGGSQAVRLCYARDKFGAAGLAGGAGAEALEAAQVGFLCRRCAHQGLASSRGCASNP